MSLLWMDYDAEFKNLVEAAYECEKSGTSKCLIPRSPRVERIIYRDTRYNIDFLYTSYVLGDDKVMRRYAVWLYELMVGILEGRATESEVKVYVLDHFEFIRKGARKAVDAQKLAEVERLLTLAQESVRARCESEQPSEFATLPESGGSRYEEEIGQYMAALFAKDARQAMLLIQEFERRGIPLNDIYADILAESMRRVGALWHASKITVDTEHYCTSVTQTAMSQMYQNVFATERCGKTILVACPGAELHEMGARMVADIFEGGGWDSIYLGAAVPEEYVLSAIEENEPQVVALSVTMPQFLIDCENLVRAIRRAFPGIAIAVGGGAFADTHDIWKCWPIDLHTEDARDLLRQANELVGD